MNRLWFGIGLLVLLLVLAMATGVILDRVQQPVIQSLEAAAGADDLEAGAELARRAQQVWDRNRHGLAAVSVHGPLDEIDSLFAQLHAYARAGKTAEFSVCCARLAKLAAAIAEAQRFSWWNLL